MNPEDGPGVGGSAAAQASSRALAMLTLVGGFGVRVTQALSERLGEISLASNIPVLVLCQLAMHGPLRPRELQRLAGLTSGGLTRQLDRLEESGLIERSFGQVRRDRRAIVVSLTPEGRHAADSMAAVVDDHLAEWRAFAAELAAVLESATGSGPAPGERPS